jgi:[ribosomal protein S5]-alanine N-acetyltransferase
MPEMPILETERLLIRPFELGDLDSVYRFFDLDSSGSEPGFDEKEALRQRADWLQWASLNPRQLAELDQPPYGDRAVILKQPGVLIGAVGYVPCLAPFSQLPNFDYYDPTGNPSYFTAELGLYYAISPSSQMQGFATEAAAALVGYAFLDLRIKQIIATTEYNNLASQGVMRKLGMTLASNPLPEPSWLQVIGVLKNST